MVKFFALIFIILIFFKMICSVNSEELLSNNSEIIKLDFFEIGAIDNKKLYIPIVNDYQPLRSSFKRASEVCSLLPNHGRIINSEEYINVLSSNYFMNLFKEALFIPFWLTNERVVTRFDIVIESRIANENTNYNFICSA